MDSSIQTIINVAGTAASASDLTAAYTGNANLINVKGATEITLYVNYAQGATESSNSIEVEVLFSPDGTTFSKGVDESNAGGVDTVTYRTHYTFDAVASAESFDSFRLPTFTNINDAVMKVSVKETGKASNFGTFFIQAYKRGI